MTISEMHVWFRQYAQQMGMQNVRAILPEQIDNLINTAIKDTIDEVINKSVGTTNDRVITDNSKLANINALRTLYAVKTFNCYEGNFVSSYKNEPFVFTSQNIGDVLYFVDFSIRYATLKPGNPDISDVGNINAGLAPYVNNYKELRKHYDDLIKAIEEGRDPETTDDEFPTYSEMLKRFDVLIKAAVSTKWFPIRIIDDSYLSDVLNDWVLAPRIRTPVMVVYTNDESSFTRKGDNKFELYVGENDSSGLTNITSTNIISQIRCSYIKKPKEVHYLSDVGGINVDSDLPEQLQIPMLKHAVDLYRVSINGSLYSNQQNTQQNQQEIARNNARPDNEGYQS